FPDPVERAGREPLSESLRGVAVADPFAERAAAGPLVGVIQEFAQPALMRLWKMQIGEPRERPERVVARAPAPARDDIERDGEAGAVLAAAAFDDERLGRRLERVEQRAQ